MTFLFVLITVFVDHFYLCGSWHSPPACTFLVYFHLLSIKLVEKGRVGCFLVLWSSLLHWTVGASHTTIAEELISPNLSSFDKKN